MSASTCTTAALRGMRASDPRPSCTAISTKIRTGSSWCLKICATWRCRSRSRASRPAGRGSRCGRSPSCTGSSGARSITRPCRVAAMSSARGSGASCRSPVCYAFRSFSSASATPFPGRPAGWSRLWGRGSPCTSRRSRPGPGPSSTATTGGRTCFSAPKSASTPAPALPPGPTSQWWTGRAAGWAPASTTWRTSSGPTSSPATAAASSARRSVSTTTSCAAWGPGTSRSTTAGAAIARTC